VILGTSDIFVHHRTAVPTTSSAPFGYYLPLQPPSSSSSSSYPWTTHHQPSPSTTTAPLTDAAPEGVTDEWQWRVITAAATTTSTTDSSLRSAIPTETLMYPISAFL
jgi:hypothetical protein